MEKGIVSNNQIIILKGARNSGKTTEAERLSTLIPSLRGFISLSSGVKDEITLLDLDNKNRLPLMSRFFESPNTIGPYHYLESTFSYAEKKEFKENDLVIIDEVGRLETMGCGFDPLIKKLLKIKITLILVVRTEFVDLIRDEYKINADIASIDEIENLLKEKGLL